MVLDYSLREKFVGGNMDNLYQYFGAQVKKDGVFFRLWAGQAKAVSLIGDFNAWDREKNPMQRVEDGIWELELKGLKPGQIYKYALLDIHDKWTNKADPCAFYSELRPDTASVIYDLKEIKKTRTSILKNHYEGPLNIYEIHLGSWKRKANGDFFSYRELAPLLAEHLKSHSYNCLEIMPVMEHPLDASWGYQTTGFYSVTSRYGSPADFKYLIDYLHKEKIAVILDWSPGHFCPDQHSLREFDGTRLYETRAHPEWGTLNFDLSKGQVRSFLISNALFWFDIFNIDGLRVDAVSSMLYLNYGMKDGPLIRNTEGGLENLHAVNFIREMNKKVFASYPHALMIAEESTTWPMVTWPVHEGGLGFNYKWNMGWMNDTLKYAELEPYFKGFNHNLLNFSMFYAFSENFILPLSHDEVVHGKKSLLNKMPGIYEEKFANLRTILSWMICHPGKKLTFMGVELAPFIEWSEDMELEWFMLDYEIHAAFNTFVKKLNRLYLKEEALWKKDKGWEGFAWIDAENHAQKMLSFVRKGEESTLIIILNFSEFAYSGFCLGAPEEGTYSLLLNSDESQFGGTGYKVKKTAKTRKKKIHGFEDAVNLNIPAFSALIYKKRK